MAPHPVRAHCACKGLNMHTLVTFTHTCACTPTHTHTHRLVVTILYIFLSFHRTSFWGTFSTCTPSPLIAWWSL